MEHMLIVHVLLDAQAGGLTHAAMVPTKLLVGPWAGFVAVVAGTWRVSLSKHRRSGEKKQSQKSGIVWLRVRSNSYELSRTGANRDCLIGSLRVYLCQVFLPVYLFTAF